jgi:putative protein-disulfide isomerase
MTATLHYIFDPLCGWCYGAEPLAQAAAGVPELTIALHAGGLWPEPTVLPDDMRNYIAEADSRLSRLSGQPLGDNYRNELLFDPELVLDSKPTTSAVLAAEKLANKGLAMLAAIQHAHYVDGRHVVRAEVLADLAAGLSLDRTAFTAAFEAADADAHIAATRSLMQRLGAQGFPTFILEMNGQWRGVDHNRFQRDAAGFTRWLESAVTESAGSVDNAGGSK